MNELAHCEAIAKPRFAGSDRHKLIVEMRQHSTLLTAVEKRGAQRKRKEPDVTETLSRPTPPAIGRTVTSVVIGPITNRIAAVTLITTLE